MIFFDRKTVKLDIIKKKYLLAEGRRKKNYICWLKDAESTIRSKIKGTLIAEFIKWRTEVNATEKTNTYDEAHIQKFEIRFRGSD
jgi:hypothetical protein